MDKKRALTLTFSEISLDDVPLVGGKNASLGEMYQQLTTHGIRVPNGFAITASAYRLFLEKAGLKQKFQQLLKNLDIGNYQKVAFVGNSVRSLIIKAHFPAELNTEIIQQYRALSKSYGVKDVDVAVRSSATAEDLLDASFAGQQESYLNVQGEQDLLLACKRCIASLFTNRAIIYRQSKGFDHLEVALSIGVQKMVRSDKAGSGVMFTLDTESGFRNAVLINAGYGLGENIVKGRINPDEYYIFKPSLAKKLPCILQKRKGNKEVRMIYHGHKVKNISVSLPDRNKYVLTDDEIAVLARWGVMIEEYYSKRYKRTTAMDIEWAKDGVRNELFIVQARPETVHAAKDQTVLEQYSLGKTPAPLVQGASVGNKIGAGKVNVIKSVSQIEKFHPGEVLVTEMTDPDWVGIMKKAAAIVTNRGGRSCHAAIVSRELGIPCIVGTRNATSILKTGQFVTVSCAEGEQGKVYAGKIPFNIRKINIKEFPPIKTKILLNIGNPEEAFAQSFLPVDGVGLAREEFIISSYIRIHPLALLHLSTLKDTKAKKEIEKITADYKDKKEFFIEKLKEGIATIAAAFYPREVIVRFSDFKSNEYANLLGGKEFEPKEDNPMLGWRGASRYYDVKYSKAFALECEAFRRVQAMGLNNIKVMVPMCRTIDEGKKVLAEIKKSKLHGVQTYVMAEIPANIILADQFSELFDGFSIGSNDLTQTTLAVDRDSELVAGIFDERNPAVQWMIQHLIETAHAKGRKVGICGDAPSTYPEIVRFLLKHKIDSISLSPDAVIKTRLFVTELEKKK